MASEKANSDMFGIRSEGHAHEDQQERRIEAMHLGFTEFIEKCDPAHLISSRHLDAPTASTPYTPSAVVSAISLQCYEKLVETDAILTPMKAMQMELEAANKSDMRVHGMCNLELSVHGLLIHIDAVVVDLNCQAILGMDILGDASKLPFILDLVDGTLSGGGYETIQLHR